MRRKLTKETLHQFMRELGAAAQGPGKVYLAGGATALLLGFREQTLDVDLKLDPEPKGAFEAIARLKNKLDVNVELVAPDDFIPAAEGWRERSRLIDTHGGVEFYHYDLSLQALAKLERGHVQDLDDVARLLSGGYVSAGELQVRLAVIEPELPRYPAVDAAQFKRRVQEFLARQQA
jgi:hypothetical protein